MRNESTGKIISWRTGTVLSLMILLFSCSKSSGPDGGSSTITSFSFLAGGNPIPVSSDGSINGTTITVFLPPGTNVNALTATFSVADSGSVQVNGTAQESGKTQNDFSLPVTYTLTAPGGAIRNYTVIVMTGIPAIEQNVSAFMTKYNIPGMSIAITLNDRLVYVNSYGKASIEDNQAVQTNSLFRISSLSKQITSAAIMKLIDQGKITMDQTVFGDQGILGNSFGSQPYGPGITSITVGQLLHHTEGGWPDNSTDPFGTNPTYTIQQLIGWGLNNVPLLDPVPGNSFYYSHFGYSVLGRVIEKITSETYQQAVQELVLQPSGITDMQIGGSTLAERLSNEVKYYGQNDENPYGINITRMDAANGWVATATDMARFMAHVDGLSALTILSPNAVKLMATGSTANPGYACGWEINSLNWWHHGNWPGSGSTEAITTQNGNFNYIILVNTGSNDSNFGNDMDNIFWNALPNIPEWPAYDLF